MRPKLVQGTPLEYGKLMEQIYNFNDLPDPKNATKEEQEAFHNMQNNLSILNDNNYETKGKSKRNNSNDSDEENEINSKKLKVNHVKETNRVGSQYMQRSADDIDDTSDDDDDEVPILPILRQEVS
ncbi:unnamed protein product [Rhizophagus irregularis]|nr:unnamed protein product [Rhizophagus irregularis]